MSPKPWRCERCDARLGLVRELPGQPLRWRLYLDIIRYIDIDDHRMFVVCGCGHENTWHFRRPAGQ